MLPIAGATRDTVKNGASKPAIMQSPQTVACNTHKLRMLPLPGCSTPHHLQLLLKPVSACPRRPHLHPGICCCCQGICQLQLQAAALCVRLLCPLADSSKLALEPLALSLQADSQRSSSRSDVLRHWHKTNRMIACHQQLKLNSDTKHIDLRSKAGSSARRMGGSP